MDKSLARYLAQVVGNISKSPLPNEILETAKLCLLDFLASCYAGAETKIANSGFATLQSFGEGEAVLLSGRGKSSMLGATFFHSLIATIEDLDDAHRFASGLHMSATTFPVILAMGGKLFLALDNNLLKAAVAGYEISSRLTRAADTWISRTRISLHGYRGSIWCMCIGMCSARAWMKTVIENALRYYGFGGRWFVCLPGRRINCSSCPCGMGINQRSASRQLGRARG